MGAPVRPSPRRVETPVVSWYSLEPVVVSRRSPWNDFGDEDAGVVPDVWVVAAAGDAEAETGVTLEREDKEIVSTRVRSEVRAYILHRGRL